MSDASGNTDTPANAPEQEKREYEIWKSMVRAMFQAVACIGHGVPERYGKTLMRGLVHHILEQHWGGTEYEKAFVYECYESYGWEPYEEEDSDDE